MVYRRLIGAAVGVALSVGLGGALLPWRAHLGIAVAALVFVLPVVAGVIIGGFTAGAASVVAGFVVYDYWFIPPYDRLSVANNQDWLTLAVYVLFVTPDVRARMQALQSRIIRGSDPRTDHDRH